MDNIGIYLYGASGHAKVIKDIIEANGEQVLGYVDDNEELTEFENLEVAHNAYGMAPFIISIGNNSIRKRIAESLESDYATAVHPSASVSPSATIGRGTVVMAGAIINSSAMVGNHCIVNTGVSIDHECVLEDYVHLSPHATLCGNVKIGEGSWIGAGAVVIQGIKIGRWSIVGAGAVVTHDVPDYTEVVGVPAKPVKSLDTK